ncbi:class I SAM-dependent methyltransferase [Nocardioides sp.]|uniref:class I SAM-dependent methyltransferase n=1 Tax=Nocardioides sp. TaxID=35761 RepID=UPI002BD4A4F2|nr:class I SAM-dependent methyltransferase [Nocardioides sp.]HXH77208.1 class I SAM-dependent methyltransferase [Nocardioides sp.]
MVTHVSDDDIGAIPGWFLDYDVDLFRLLLGKTTERLGQGNLAELGVYLGKSAVLLGGALSDDEVLTVVDLFGEDAATVDNQSENDDQYVGLSRAAFEANYLKVHGRLPTIVTGPSESIVDHATRGSHRFVHVDASHHYEHVVGDIQAARELLMDDGVVVFDDYRSEHTPGVSAAVWRATASGLHPFALSPVKLYATFGNPQPWFDDVRAWATDSRWPHEFQHLAGGGVVRLWRGQQHSAAASTGRRSLRSRARNWVMAQRR